ncbi:MAG: hypothetical protein Ct9H300mP26_5710 [Acidimicrobiales bacterium]|nr:MAG: hypothetical protein Ct9H300mP26_5710 [Acidimicrobiales bacterium]
MIAGVVIEHELEAFAANRAMLVLVPAASRLLAQLAAFFRAGFRPSFT